MSRRRKIQNQGYAVREKKASKGIGMVITAPFKLIGKLFKPSKRKR